MTIKNLRYISYIIMSHLLIIVVNLKFILLITKSMNRSVYYLVNENTILIAFFIVIILKKNKYKLLFIDEVRNQKSDSPQLFIRSRLKSQT